MRRRVQVHGCCDKMLPYRRSFCPRSADRSLNSRASINTNNNNESPINCRPSSPSCYFVNATDINTTYCDMYTPVFKQITSPRLLEIPERNGDDASQTFALSAQRPRRHARTEHARTRTHLILSIRQERYFVYLINHAPLRRNANSFRIRIACVFGPNCAPNAPNTEQSAQCKQTHAGAHTNANTHFAVVITGAASGQLN